VSSATEGTSAGSKEPALYETIRDQLIEEIRTGSAYPAGALLPSVREMTVKWSVSTTTARKVLAELVAAGYARSEGTRGHVSAGPIPATKPKVTASETEEPVRGTLTVRTLQGVPALENAVAEMTAVDVRAEVPPAEVALALRVAEPSAPLIVRRTLSKDEHGVPVELQTSYFTNAIVADVSQDAHEASDRLEDVEARSGQSTRWGRQHLMARHPTDSEAAALALNPTSSVLVRVRQMIQGEDMPVAYSEVVWPGEGVRLLL